MRAELDFPTLYGPRWRQQEWMSAAACKGKVDLFFAPAGEREDARLLREAKARCVCVQCPVLEECRSYARRVGELGFWGGENDEQRAAFRRRARRAAAARSQPLAS
jgi:WhiB family redox-sensing transcriptional regulator